MDFACKMANFKFFSYNLHKVKRTTAVISWCTQRNVNANLREFKIQAVQLAVHGNKAVVHLHCFATT